jgi:hypothetical protein
MNDNILIPLPGFALPEDFPWRVGFVALVDDQLRRLRATGHFLPPRFFGYYFQGRVPVAVGGSWTVTLEGNTPASLLPDLMDQMTDGKYSIVAPRRDSAPDFMLVHDRRDGACWLWSYDQGLRFIESVEPVLEPAERPRSK